MSLRSLIVAAQGLIGSAARAAITIGSLGYIQMPAPSPEPAIIGTPGMLWRLKRKQDDERTMRICTLAVGSGIVR